MKYKIKSTLPYELKNGEKLNQENPVGFLIPSREARENVLPGSVVRLIFKIQIGNLICTESMLVIVVKKTPDHYVGLLANDPVGTSKIKYGDEIKFQPEHVIEIRGPHEDGDWICDECLKAAKEAEAAKK